MSNNNICYMQYVKMLMKTNVSFYNYIYNFLYTIQYYTIHCIRRPHTHICKYIRNIMHSLYIFIYMYIILMNVAYII